MVKIKLGVTAPVFFKCSVHELFADNPERLYPHDLSALMSNPVITSVNFIFCHHVYVGSEFLYIT
jgi:hypothetical protein